MHAALITSSECSTQCRKQGQDTEVAEFVEPVRALWVEQIEARDQLEVQRFGASFASSVDDAVGDAFEEYEGDIALMDYRSTMAMAAERRWRSTARTLITRRASNAFGSCRAGVRRPSEVARLVRDVSRYGAACHSRRRWRHHW